MSFEALETSFEALESNFVADHNDFRQVKTILRRFVAVHGEAHVMGLARPMAWVLPVRQVFLQRVSPFFIFSCGSTEMERKEDPCTTLICYFFSHFNFLQFLSDDNMSNGDWRL
jgi:hypothetical protein